MSVSMQAAAAHRSSRDVLALTHLRVVRENAGLSQQALHERSGVSRKTIIMIEAGRPAWPSTAQKLADALGVKIPDLR